MDCSKLRRRDLGAFAVAVGSLGGGLSAGYLGSGAVQRIFGSSTEREERRPTLWAADRAGHALFGLGADGGVVQRIEIDAPMEVLRRPGGGCYVLSALDRRRAGRSRWFEWTGSELRATHPGACLSAASQLPSPEVIGGGVIRLRREATGGSVWLLREGQGTTTVLERWRRRGRRWQLSVSVDLPFTARALAPAPGRVWVAGDRTPVALHVDEAGQVRLDVSLEGADGVEDALVIPAELGGGVWLAACGALLRLDGTGRRRPGQGGFAHLVSLAPGPQSSPS